MRNTRPSVRTLTALVCLSATGCSTMQVLPRGEYAALPERRGVVAELRDGRTYKFDFARFGPDSMIGHRLAETEGPIEQYFTVAIPLDSLDKLSARRTSWLRTGLIAGGVAVAAVTTVAAKKGSTPPADTGPELPGGIDP
jgi:hypothetical protein